jgi:hypothetical protein
MTLEHLDTIIAFVVILAGVSLLVTVFTQTVSALLGLRGTNLRWGIETLLKELDPSLKAHAATITQEVLRHPLISDSTLSRFDLKVLDHWKLASAIRKEELIEILHMLARSDQKGGRAPDPWRSALASSLRQVDQTAASDLALMVPQIKKLFPDDMKAEQAVAQVMTSAEQLQASINQWFDSMMDRVSQRFVTHTRIWTIIFSVFVAFALHLDALKLLAQLSTDAEMRARLVASADALTKKADEVLVAPADGTSSAYVQAMKRLIGTHESELGAIGEPPGFVGLADAKEWLSTQLEAAQVRDAEKWQQEYDLLVPQAALLKAADNLRSILKDKLPFQLIPDPYPTPWYNYWTPNWLHFLGILASAALLGLGAPFWFNILKTLTNLRPVLATKEQQQRKGSKKS